MATIPRTVATRSLDTGNVVQYPQGSPIGSAIEGLGGDLQRVAAHIKEKKDRRDAFLETTLASEFDAATDNLSYQAVQNAPADGSGIYDNTVGAIDPTTGQVQKPGGFDMLANDFLERVPESQREKFQGRLPEMRIRLATRMAAAQSGVEQKYYLTETERITNGLVNQILTSDPNDRQTFDQVRQRGTEVITNSNLLPLQKKVLLDRWKGESGVALAQSILTKDPKSAPKLREMLGFGTVAAGGGDPVNTVVSKIIGVESAGDPNAKNPNSSAEGLGQFIDSTWLATIRAHRPDIAASKSAAEILALKKNAPLARQMTEALTRDNAEYLRNRGLQTTPGNLYLAHFLGPAGAVQALKADPTTPIAQIVGQDAMRANSFLSGKSAADVIAWASKKMGGGDSGGAAAVDPAFADISPEDRLGLFNQVKAAEGRNAADFEAGLNDYMAFVRDGREPANAADYDTTQIFANLPPDRASKIQEEINQARAYGNDKKALEFASPAEVQEVLTARAAQLQAPTDYRQNVQDLGGLMAVVKARNEQIAADPAAYVMKQPAIGGAFQVLQQSPSPPAAANFVRSVLAEQTRLGVPAADQRILPGAVRDRIVAGFASPQENNQNVASMMRGLETQWGKDWPRVFGELAGSKGLPGAALVVGAMNRPDQARAAEVLAEAAKIGTDALEKAVGSTVKKDIATRLDENMAAFAATLASNGSSGVSTFNTFREATYQLALSYGRGESPIEAADRAFKDVIERKYSLRDTYRVPVEYDADEITNNAESIISRMTGIGLTLPASDMNETDTRAAYLSQIKANGYWVTSGDESGLTLFDETGTAVTKADGKPLSFTWSQIIGTARGSQPADPAVAAPQAPFADQVRDLEMQRMETNARRAGQFAPQPGPGKPTVRDSLDERRDNLFQNAPETSFGGAM